MDLKQKIKEQEAKIQEIGNNYALAQVSVQDLGQALLKAQGALELLKELESEELKK